MWPRGCVLLHHTLLLHFMVGKNKIYKIETCTYRALSWQQLFFVFYFFCLTELLDLEWTSFQSRWLCVLYQTHLLRVLPRVGSSGKEYPTRQERKCRVWVSCSCLKDRCTSVQETKNCNRTVSRLSLHLVYAIDYRLTIEKNRFRLAFLFLLH